MLVSIVIINYNTPRLVLECLASIQANLTIPHEVIVVDNASAEPVDVSRFPQARYFPLSTNKGFGGGNNYGAKQAKGDYLWFLNSDTLLPDGSIEKLFSFMGEHPEAGVASPLLYNDVQCKSLQPDFYANFQSFSSLILRKARPDIDLSSAFVPVDVVVGASLVMRRSLFESLRGFDEKFFMFFEDDDICYRARQSGCEVGIVTNAKIVHLQGKSIADNKKRKGFYYASQGYFWQKHYGSLAALGMKALRFPYAFLRNLKVRA